jgi:hypothetical protein
MLQDLKPDRTPPQMFASIGVEDHSWLSYPGRALKFVLACLWAPIVALIFLIYGVPQLIVVIFRLPWILRASRQRWEEERKELQQSGRLISSAKLQEYAIRGEGLAIRDLGGRLWWAKDPPERVREVDSNQRQSLRVVRLYQLSGLPEVESNRIADLEYAALVDLPERKTRRATWNRLERESQIMMLSFQFKE